MTHDPDAGTRRAPVPPLPLPHELPRVPVGELLARRFDVSVTTIVAGAGFGKTTAVSQAIRTNDVEPRGIDLWVSCEPGDEEAARLAAAIIGRNQTGRGPTAAVLAALGELAPNDVCIVVDDVHVLPDGCSSQVMLAELVERLPPHAHLLLSSREPPPVRLERLRAAGQVVDITEADLGFSENEVASLARLHGRDEPIGTDLAGWPSLVQLALSARGAAPTRFLWEEVVADLPPDLRVGLLALATLGWGSATDVEQIAGRAVDCDQLADRVPLVRRDDRGGYLVHHLWEDATDRIFAGAELDDVRRRALALFAERRETFRLGTAAFAWGSALSQREAALALVRDTLGALPVQTAQNWVDRADPQIASSPEVRLLNGAIRHACSDTDASLDGELIELADELAATGTEARAVALALAAIVAFHRGDQARLFEVGTIAAATPGAAEIPLLAFLTGAAEAAFASLTGDIDTAISILDTLAYDDVPERATELVYRLRATMVMLAGRADESARFDRVLERSHDPHVRWLPTFLRWQSTDPWVAVDLAVDGDPTAAPIGETNDRDRYIHAAHYAFVGAARGDLATVRRLRSMVDAMRARSEVRDATIGVLSAAASRVAEHDEDGAAAVFADHLERFPLSDSLGAAHLRRHLAIGYVLDESVRSHIDSLHLGKLHVATRDAAAGLVAARAGTLRQRFALPDAATAVTSFPLVWTVELAVRAQTSGVTDAHDLIREVGAHHRSAVRAELEVWAAGDGTATSLAASELLEVIRVRPSTRIDVLGPLRVAGGATMTTMPPELRRGRVRALLELLVLRSPIERERVVELMWPDTDVDRARQNLRSTLARLRKGLGDTGADGSRSPIEADRDRIQLGPPQLVEIDLAEFRGHVVTAERHRAAGDSAAMIDALSSAVELWRGDPFDDLASVAGLEADVEHVRRELVEAGLRLGEALIVAGRFDEVLDSVEKCLAAAPYDERAHRLAIAAHMHRRDRLGVDAAVTRVHGALDEIGAEPETSTRMLLRRVADLR